MAFISMVFASIFIGAILLGLLFLLIGIILNIIWHVKKKKGQETSRALRISARVFTVWGLLQGIGPIAFVAVMILLNR